MRAAVHERYGPPEVLEVREVPTPVPGPGEVRVAVHATTVNRTDVGFRRADPFIVRPFSGLVRPRHRILGTELAGVVDATGPGVTRFAEGDRVFGVHADRFGAHAQYVCVGEERPLATMPDDVGYDQAAAVCDGAILALTYLRSAKVGPGTRLAVFGASGSIGTAAVQLASHLGADVTAVCQTAGLDVVRSLGPDTVIDGTREDFARRGETWDVIFDAVGKSAFARCRRALTPDGIYTSTDLGPWQQNPPLALWTRVVGHQRVLFPLPRYTRDDVLHLRDLVESGAYRPVIDRRYPLEEVVEATRYVETGQKIGNVVLLVDHAARSA